MDLAENVAVNEPPDKATSAMLLRLSVALVLSLLAAAEDVPNPLTVAVMSEPDVFTTTSCALPVELILVATASSEGWLDTAPIRTYPGRITRLKLPMAYNTLLVAYVPLLVF